jgi:hypothetical protein
MPAAPSAVSGCANPCTTESSLVCIDSENFGICTGGCAVPQQVAAGTTCSNGQIVKRRVIGRFRADLMRLFA